MNYGDCKTGTETKHILQSINKLNIFEHANAAADFDDNFGEEEEDYEVDDDNSGDENYGRSAKMQGKGGLTTGIFTQRPTNSTTPRKAADRGLEITCWLYTVTSAGSAGTQRTCLASHKCFQHFI